MGGQAAKSLSNWSLPNSPIFGTGGSGTPTLTDSGTIADPGGTPWVTSPWDAIKNGLEGKGWSTGKFDVVSNMLDKWNPQVSKNPDGTDKHALKDFSKEAPTLGVGGAGGLGNWVDENGNLKANATMTPQITKNDASARAGGQNVDMGAFNKLTDYANSTSDSPWLSLTKEKIAGQTAGLRDQGARDAMVSAGGAMSSAAAHGGLSGGAAARIAARGADSASMASQNASRWGEQGKLDAGIFEAKDRMDTLRQIPGMDLSLANFNLGKDRGADAIANQAMGMNVQNAIGGVDQGNQNILNKYSEDMKKYVGDVTADATAKSGKRK